MFALFLRSTGEQSFELSKRRRRQKEFNVGVGFGLQFDQGSLGGIAADGDLGGANNRNLDSGFVCHERHSSIRPPFKASAVDSKEPPLFSDVARSKGSF